jgi:hypothetical protein
MSTDLIERPRRQPLRTKNLNIPVSPQELDRLHAIAAERCIPMAAYVRMMLLGGRMSDPM